MSASNQTIYPPIVRRGVPIALMMLYFVAAAIKSWSFIQDGRFWGEEGTIFYPNISSSSFIEGVLFVYNGHIELWTNLIIKIASIFGVEHAPRISVWLSILAQSLPIALIIKYRRTFSLSDFGVAAIIIIAAGLPQAPEVFSNTINLHFHFAIAVAIIASLDHKSLDNRLLNRGVLLASGLSGIPSNFLAPVFLYRAIRSRNKESYIQLAIISCTSLFQLITILFHAEEIAQRPYSFQIEQWWFSILNQTTLSPMLGLDLGQMFFTIFKNAVSGNRSCILFSAFVSLPLLSLIYCALKSQNSACRWLMASALLLLFLSMLTSLEGIGDVIILMGGGRYFYAPTLLFAVCFISMYQRFGWQEYALLSMVLITATTSLPNNFSGPPWLESYHQAVSQGQTQVPTWPQGWVLKLSKP